MTDEDSPAEIILITMSPTIPEHYKVPVELNAKILVMELDRSSSISCKQEDMVNIIKQSSTKLSTENAKIKTKLQNSEAVDLLLVVVKGL